VFDNATGDDIGILVVDSAAAHGSADMTRAVVSPGYCDADQGAAMATVFHLLSCFSPGQAFATRSLPDELPGQEVFNFPES
jgi:hypothetical protein